jgi:hypothetical protein
VQAQYSYGLQVIPGGVQVGNLFFTRKGMVEMAKRIQKKDVVKRLASRLSVDEKLSEEYLDGVLETLYEAFNNGGRATRST